LSS
ncbi:chorismate mutase, partial [Vibrio parahaemolyticus 861]|jgi:hypothetical protein